MPIVQCFLASDLLELLDQIAEIQRQPGETPNTGRALRRLILKEAMRLKIANTLISLEPNGEVPGGPPIVIDTASI